MGLVIILALGLYLAIAIGVIAWAVSHAKKNGKSAIKWGSTAALIMYLIPFWDWLPTVAAHKYYCSTEAGFWVYKTPEEWNKENPGVMETLIDNSPQEYPNWPMEIWNDKKIDNINQRFGLLYLDHLVNSTERELFLHQWRWRIELLDKKTGDILARYVDFSSGNGFIGGESEPRFWLHNDYCTDGITNRTKFSGFIKQFRGAQ